MFFFKQSTKNKTWYSQIRSDLPCVACGPNKSKTQRKGLWIFVKLKTYFLSCKIIYDHEAFTENLFGGCGGWGVGGGGDTHPTPPRFRNPFICLYVLQHAELFCKMKASRTPFLERFMLVWSRTYGCHDFFHLDSCSNVLFFCLLLWQISRMLAAKVSLAARVDALGEDSGTAMGVENRAKLEMRLKALEENQVINRFPIFPRLTDIAWLTAFSNRYWRSFGHLV